MITIQLITTEQTYPIRHKELRQGFPIETCYWVGDNDATTFHLGAFEEETIVGVVSLMKTDNGYQLRGMAVLSNHQGKNIGSLLVKKAEEILKENNVDYLWMNARIGAMKFYEKLNYRTEGEVFEIETVGKHIRMCKKL